MPISGIWTVQERINVPRWFGSEHQLLNVKTLESDRGDAFGQVILAYLLHKERVETVERDDGFIDLSKRLPYYFSDYRHWMVIERRAIRFARSRVLDVGCGAGRVCLYLQKKGLDVTGIDISPKAIEVCKKRGVKKALVVPIEKIGRFKQGSFDTIVMFGNNFGLFGNSKKAKASLKQIHRITSKDAIILAGTRDPYKTKDPVHLAYHELNRKRGRMAGQLRIRTRYKQYVGKCVDYLFVSKEETRGILIGTGWKVKQFIGKGSLYVAVITKETYGPA
jgi:SAM-dependent methyltransferase